LNFTLGAQRAICDQIEGCDANHAEMRAAVAEYIRANPDYFAPFVEDDKTLEQVGRHWCARVIPTSKPAVETCI